MNKSSAVVTIQGCSVALPHVGRVGDIQSMGVRWGWHALIQGESHWFGFSTKREAERARAEFVQALTDWWAGQD